MSVRSSLFPVILNVDQLDFVFLLNLNVRQNPMGEAPSHPGCCRFGMDNVTWVNFFTRELTDTAAPSFSSISFAI